MKQELIPIFRIPRINPERVDSHATGTLMRIDDKFFLATASHVFKHEDLGSLRISTPSKSIVLAGKAITVDPGEKDKEEDPIDFGIVPLTNEEGVELTKYHRFLDVMALKPQDHERISAKCHISGYPGMENMPDRNMEELASNLYRIDCQTDKNLLKHSRIKRHKTVPEDYIALRYNPQKISVDPDADYGKVKDVKGMSGGAIYAGSIPFDNPFAKAKQPSCQYVGMLLQTDKDRPKSRTGEFLIYGLSLVAIQKILNQWKRCGKLPKDASDLRFTSS